MELKRVLQESHCWLSMLAFFPCFYYGGVAGFATQTIFGGGLACLVDWHIGPTMKNNVKRIVERGLVPNEFSVLLGMYLTIFTSEAIAVGLAIISGCFDVSPHFDLKLAINVLTAISFNEMVFTATHRFFLHGTELGARIHQIHHTCQPSSFSTAFIFHFLDSNTEFTFSFVCMALFCHTVQQDPFSLLVSMQIAYVWYTVAGHSENLRFAHFNHHKWINSNYTAYVNIRGFHGQDHVRKLCNSYNKDSTKSSQIKVS